MIDKLKTTLDDVRAEEKLKETTLRVLQSEMRRRGTTRARNPISRFAVASASVLVIVLSAVFSYRLYFTPTTYVGVDVNPSVELTLNRFDRVISSYAYNGDGEGILSGLSVRHKSYDEALTVLMDAIRQKGFMQDGGLVSVTLQTEASGREAELLAGIQSSVAGFISEHHQGTQTDVFSVSGDTQSHAHELNVSPARYLAIQELLALDPAATVESCRDHSIGELRQLVREYDGDHHVSGNTDPADESTAGSNGDNVDETCEPADDPNAEQAGDHHGDSSSHHD